MGNTYRSTIVPSIRNRAHSWGDRTNPIVAKCQARLYTANRAAAIQPARRARNTALVFEVFVQLKKFFSGALSFATLISFFVFSSTVYAASPPVRIVSLNLCLDQLVLSLVPAKNIVSVTYLAADPAYSFTAAKARKVHLNHGQAEEILPLKPDIILANRWSARAVTRLMGRLGYRVERFPHATDFKTMRTTIKRLSKILGVDAQGAEMIRRFDAELSRLAPAAGARRPVAAMYWTGGMTSGRGSLAGAILTASGFDNLADRLRLEGTAQLGVEALLRHPYDLLIIADARSIAPSLARQSLGHPILRRIARSRSVLTLPRRYLMCGVPQALEAVRLIRARRPHAPDQ